MYMCIEFICRFLHDIWETYHIGVSVNTPLLHYYKGWKLHCIAPSLSSEYAHVTTGLFVWCWKASKRKTHGIEPVGGNTRWKSHSMVREEIDCEKIGSGAAVRLGGKETQFPPSYLCDCQFLPFPRAHWHLTPSLQLILKQEKKPPRITLLLSGTRATMAAFQLFLGKLHNDLISLGRHKWPIEWTPLLSFHLFRRLPRVTFAKQFGYY